MPWNFHDDTLPALKATSASPKEVIMHLTNEKRDEELIDLGSAVEATKGNMPGITDSFGQNQAPQGIGLADD